MKNFMLSFVHIACAAVLMMQACSHSANTKLKGEWKTTDGSTKLTITDNKFTEDTGSPVTEDYFVKDNVIFTSYEGNQPYTRFVIQKLDEHHLTLLYPDSVVMAFVRE